MYMDTNVYSTLHTLVPMEFYIKFMEMAICNSFMAKKNIMKYILVYIWLDLSYIF